MRRGLNHFRKSVYNQVFCVSVFSSRVLPHKIIITYENVTIELLRKRSEHNEGDIGSLEELALHQEDIDEIQHLQNWCRDLKILLLQANLISKIENVTKLKKLEYLNLALNNIERIENLEGCESLNKLDLTLNFIGDITSVRNLKKNEFLRELFLVGNPCTDYKGYREFVIGTLPQLAYLDGKAIERADRIQASQRYDEIRKAIIVEARTYFQQRLIQKELKDRAKKSKGCTITEITEDGKEDDRPEEEILKEYWDEVSDNSPESRIEIAEAIRKSREIKEGKPENEPPKRTIRFFNNAGRPLNINEAKIKYTLTEDDATNCLVLDVAVYKYLDTSHVDVDIQPSYVKVVIKSKVLQLVLQEEVHPDSSIAQRSTTTGHLVVRMPRVNGVIRLKERNEEVKKATNVQRNPRREYLEIGRGDDMDFSRIVKRPEDRDVARFKGSRKEVPHDFVDDPDVPPLE